MRNYTGLVNGSNGSTTGAALPAGRASASRSRCAICHDLGSRLTRSGENDEESSDVSSHRGMVPRPSIPSFLSGLGEERAAAPQLRRLIKLKSPREISLMREAGRVVARRSTRSARWPRRGSPPPTWTRPWPRSSASTTPLPCSSAIPARSRASRRSRPSSAPASTNRSSTASPTAARSGGRHRLDRYRLQAQRLVRRRGGDPGHRRDPPRASRNCST